ncbi:MAG: alpha/beta fold hydrolase [Xanthobacteraceae bacterium]
MTGTLFRFIRHALAALIMVGLLGPLAAAAPAQPEQPAAQPMQSPRQATRRPIILIPGLLGSRLCRPDPADPTRSVVAWGTLGSLLRLSGLQLPPDGKDDLKPCGLVREVVYFGLYTQEVYSPIIAHLKKLGYRENRDLFAFAYDWRKSVFDNARALADFVEEKIGPDQPIDVVAHSMGGLVARVYAVKHGGSKRIARLFSAGTPFLGSVMFYESIENGWGAINLAMGGVGAFRRTMLSFPSIYELSPRYAVCCDGGLVEAENALPRDIAAWQTLGWEGIDPAAMPDLDQIFSRIDELQRIIDTPLPATVEDVLLIGVDQRTPYRITFDSKDRIATARIETTWNGDGTVVRESSTIPRAAIHPTSFGDHEHILGDAQVQEFLAVALTRGVAEAARTVKVRPRANMRSLAGVLVELVGVAITPSRTVYLAGEMATVRVQFRLGGSLPLSPGALRLVLRTPGRDDQVIALRPDLASADPSNPFEQAFVGEVPVGSQPGPRILRATVATQDGPRIVERTVGVVAR